MYSISYLFHFLQVLLHLLIDNILFDDYHFVNKRMLRPWITSSYSTVIVFITYSFSIMLHGLILPVAISISIFYKKKRSKTSVFYLFSHFFILFIAQNPLKFMMNPTTYFYLTYYTSTILRKVWHLL